MFAIVVLPSFPSTDRDGTHRRAGGQHSDGASSQAPVRSHSARSVRAKRPAGRRIRRKTASVGGQPGQTGGTSSSLTVDNPTFLTYQALSPTTGRAAATVAETTGKTRRISRLGV